MPKYFLGILALAIASPFILIAMLAVALWENAGDNWRAG